MNLLLYNIFLALYLLGVRIVSLGKPKARKWLKGREGLFKTIEEELKDKSNQRIWMHCASLGEYEQGSPLIDKLKTLYPAHHIVLTFFSPSGYEVVNRKPDERISVLYLPFDSRSNAKRFLNLVQPSLVLWVKYEYWYYILKEINARKVPLLLVSAIFRTNQAWNKWYGGLWRKMLTFFSHVFAQTDPPEPLLKYISASSITAGGDTRFDRVTTVAGNFHEVEGIRNFCDGHITLIAGSTWEEDEAVLVHYARTHTSMKIILAPHEVDDENVNGIQKLFPGSIRYSHYLSQNEQTSTHSCLIIDCIGVLSRLYAYADITYVGGGFGDDGVHNVLEPAVYGKPVIFGPEYQKYHEAEELIECGGAEPITNALELEFILNELLTHPEKRQRYGNAARAYVYSNKGATDKIVSYIQEKRLLTS